MVLSLPADELYAESDYAVDDATGPSTASITVTPPSGEFAHVDWFTYSFDDAPLTTNYVTVSIGGTEVLRWRPGVVTSVQGVQIVGPFIGDADEAIVIAAQEPGANDNVTLCCKYRTPATIT